MGPLKARKNEYTFYSLESNVPKKCLLITGSHWKSRECAGSISTLRGADPDRKSLHRADPRQHIVPDLPVDLQRFLPAVFL